MEKYDIDYGNMVISYQENLDNLLHEVLLC